MLGTKGQGGGKAGTSPSNVLFSLFLLFPGLSLSLAVWLRTRPIGVNQLFFLIEAVAGGLGEGIDEMRMGKPWESRDRDRGGAIFILRRGLDPASRHS